MFELNTMDYFIAVIKPIIDNPIPVIESLSITFVSVFLISKIRKILNN